MNISIYVVVHWKLPLLLQCHTFQRQGQSVLILYVNAVVSVTQGQGTSGNVSSPPETTTSKGKGKGGGGKGAGGGQAGGAGSRKRKNPPAQSTSEQAGSPAQAATPSQAGNDNSWQGGMQMNNQYSFLDGQDMGGGGARESLGNGLLENLDIHTDDLLHGDCK